MRYGKPFDKVDSLLSSSMSKEAWKVVKGIKVNHKDRNWFNFITRERMVGHYAKILIEDCVDFITSCIDRYNFAVD